METKQGAFFVHAPLPGSRIARILALKLDSAGLAEYIPRFVFDLVKTVYRLR